MFRTKQVVLIILAVMSSLVAGCSKSFTINHYPDFYTPSIKSVAVLPFLNDTSHKGAGIAAASHISAALAANGTYKVTDPAQLDKILKEKGMPKLPENYGDITKELAKLNMFQAFITGEVLSESFINEIVEYDEDYYYDDYPHWYYPYGYPYYWYYPYSAEYGKEAYISTKVSMVDIPGGNILSTQHLNAAADVGHVSSNEYITERALGNLSREVVGGFAIVPMTITVKPDKTLRTADSSKNGKWHFTGTFRHDMGAMYIILCLPEAAAMNEFKLTVTPAGNPSHILFSKDYTWEKDKHCQSIEFPPNQIVQMNGTGKYTVNFISRGTIVLSRNFKIR